MTAIVVVNSSTLVSDADVRHMTRAVAKQVKLHACPLWDKAPIPVVFSSSVQDAAPGMWVIAILDDPDQADALGWHTEDQGDLVYGRVFARPALDNQVSVSSVLSHEVLETLVDPNANLWADDGHGLLTALEVCDPVESDSYSISVSGQPVQVSNFVTPAWFDSMAAIGEQFDYLGSVSSPFTMTAGGYMVNLSEGQVSQQFGSQYAEWRKLTKTDTSRTARRVSH